MLFWHVDSRTDCWGPYCIPVPKAILAAGERRSDDSALRYRGNNWDVSCTLTQDSSPRTLQGARGTCGLWHVPVVTWRTVTLRELVRCTQGRPPFIWDGLQWLLLSDGNRPGTTWPWGGCGNRTQRQDENPTVLGSTVRGTAMFLTFCNYYVLLFKRVLRPSVLIHFSASTLWVLGGFLVKNCTGRSEPAITGLRWYSNCFACFFVFLPF